MEATQIIPGLWISNYYTSQNHIFIINKNIEIIINCTKTYKNKNFKNIQYIRVPVLDNKQDDQIILIFKYFDNIVDFIHKNLTKKNILVHCHMGIQRAPTIIAAYLIKYANITYEDVIKYIKQKRKMCFYKGVNFKKSLLAFEKKIQTF